MNIKRYRNIVTAVAVVATVAIAIGAVTGVWPWEHGVAVVENNTVNVTAIAEVGADG